MSENFTLKDGRTVLIRQIRAGDYETVMTYLTKFSQTPSAIWTYSYPGRPWSDKEKSVKAYEDPNQLFLGAFDGETLIGLSQIGFVKPDHPYAGKNTSFGISLLEEYTGQGIGFRLMTLMEQWARDHGAHRISDSVRQKNMRGVAFYLKCGFQIEGLAVQDAFINGEWHNTYYIGKVLE